MRIHRSHPEARFTIIPNETLRDPRLSYRARGILAEILSHQPGDWAATADEIAARARKKRGSSGEGRRLVRAAFAELQHCGYLQRVTRRGPDGRMVTDLHVYDVPAGHTEVPPTGTPVTGTPVTGTPSRRRIEKTLSPGSLGAIVRVQLHDLDDDESEKLADLIVKRNSPKNPRAYLRSIPAADLQACLQELRSSNGHAHPPRPAWCGSCDETTRMAEADDGTPYRCPVCHPLALAPG